MYHGEHTNEKMEWEGITIELLYFPSWSKTFEEVYGYPLAYLEIKVIDPEREALPITDTGYLSYHLSPVDAEAEGGPIAYVTAWLDFKAQSPEWLNKKAKLRQLDLF